MASIFIAIIEGLKLFGKKRKLQVYIENKLGSATLTLAQCIDAFFQVWTVVMCNTWSYSTIHRTYDLAKQHYYFTGHLFEKHSANF